MRTLARLESGDGVPREDTIVAVRKSLEKAGVLFITSKGNGTGVHLKE